MKLEEVGLSLKQRKLSGAFMGHPVLDNAFKIAIKPETTQLHLTILTSFDGLSLRNYDHANGARNRIYIKDQGKVSLGSSSKAGTLVEEILDMGSGVIGIGSILQIKKTLQLFFNQVGLIHSDEIRNYKALLKVNGTKIGSMLYKVYRFNSLKQLPAFAKHLIPNLSTDVVFKKPVLITDLLLTLDITTSPKNEEGFVQIKLAENIKVGRLSKDHNKNVVITSIYSISEVSTDQTASNTEKSGFSDRISLDLGVFEFETLKGIKK